MMSAIMINENIQYVGGDNIRGYNNIDMREREREVEKKKEKERERACARWVTRP